MALADRQGDRIRIASDIGGAGLSAAEARELAEMLTTLADEVSTRIPDSEFRPGAVFVDGNYANETAAVYVVTEPEPYETENAIWRVRPGSTRATWATRAHWETEDGVQFRPVPDASNSVPAAESEPEPEYKWSAVNPVTGNRLVFATEAQARKAVGYVWNGFTSYGVPMRVQRRRAGSDDVWEDA